MIIGIISVLVLTVAAAMLKGKKSELEKIQEKIEASKKQTDKSLSNVRKKINESANVVSKETVEQRIKRYQKQAKRKQLMAKLAERKAAKNTTTQRKTL